MQPVTCKASAPCRTKSHRTLYLTVDIDVLTRCVPGMVVTLEALSAVSAGLCLAHAACDKRPSLERLAVEMG